MLLSAQCIVISVFRNPQRGKEILIGKIHRFHPSRSVKDSGEDMQTDCPIVKFICQSLSSAQVIQRSKGPVSTGAYF